MTREGSLAHYGERLVHAELWMDESATMRETTESFLVHEFADALLRRHADGIDVP